MNSWSLLRQLIAYMPPPHNPIFQREISYPPLWYQWMRRAGRATGGLLMLGGLLCYGVTMLAFLVEDLLLLASIILGLWVLLLAVTLAPVIVTERERATWDTLRATPISLDELLLGKTRGALWWLRGPLRVLAGLMLLAALGVSVGCITVNPVYGDLEGASVSAYVLCLAALLLPAASALLFIADRLQQFMLFVVIALTASATARSTRTALVAAVLGVLLAFFTDIALAVLISYILSTTPARWIGTHLELAAAFGPIPGYVFQIPSPHTLAVITGTLLLRELAVRGLWKWTRRAARRD